MRFPLENTFTTNISTSKLEQISCFVIGKELSLSLKTKVTKRAFQSMLSTLQKFQLGA